MTQTNKPYTAAELSVLVEEFIIRQCSEFTLKGLYSYIIYWGMEEGRILGNQLQSKDKKRINAIIKRIVRDGRIREGNRVINSSFSDNRKANI